MRALFTAQPTNLQWNQDNFDGISFPIRSGGNYSQWLEIEKDRYRFCDQCSTSTEVFERGAVELESKCLTLVSDRGKRTVYRLAEGAGRWFLKDANGKVYGQERESQPRLHPSPEWLDNDKALEIDVPSARQIPVSNPKPVKPGSERNFFPKFDLPEINLGLRGGRLFQGSRDLLNRRSTRRDVERLFAPLNWRVVEGPTNHGVRLEARTGKLLIRVLGITGSNLHEARVIGFALDR